MEKKLNLTMNRIYKCDSKTLFAAIGEGMLFKACGAIMESTKIDFKEGGAYTMACTDCCPMTGTFKEVKPFTKIVFTWCYDSDELKKRMETLVTITIKESEGSTLLTLVHDGFETQSQVESHRDGWDKGTKGLQKSFLETTTMPMNLTLNKTYNAPVALVFEAWTKPEILKKWFSPDGRWVVEIADLNISVGGQYRVFMRSPEDRTWEAYGEYKEIEKNKKIVFTWNTPSANSTLVTVNFLEKNGKTELTLIHDLLANQEQVNEHNEGWKGCMENLNSKVFA